jgi:acetyl esterase/lipase
MKSVLLVGCFALFFASCRKEEANNGNNPASAQTILNVSYGTDAAQKMDVYLPANRSTSTTKVMVLIHGGGWNSGDKQDPLFIPFVDSIRNRLPGYAVFNINYRLSAKPLNLFPTQEMDVKQAVEFIFSKKTEYGISDKFVMAGASAGAHLAMLYAYKYNSPVKAKAVVSYFGPGDLAQMYNNPVGGNILISLVLADAIGKTPTEDPLLYFNSSPVNFISSSTAMPTILLHGGLDPLVSPQQSVAVQTKLTSAGIANQYAFYPSGGHGDWDGPTYTDGFSKIKAFLAAQVP